MYLIQCFSNFFGPRHTLTVDIFRGTLFLGRKILRHTKQVNMLKIILNYNKILVLVQNTKYKALVFEFRML